ncbi:MAG: hypothetical protein ABWZ25_12215 [Chitinophagaceae bacterium]
MNYFLLSLELFMYVFAVYIAFRKKELAIIYLPVIFFANTVIGEHFASAFIYYGIITMVLLYILRQNESFVKSNVFSILLIIYFAVLMGRSANLVNIRQDLFNVMWLFFCIPVIPVLYKKYSRETVMKELGSSSLIILLIFILNAGLSTVFRYDVYSMYGITSGVIYGNMFATDFNILAIAIFLVFMRALNSKNLLFLVVGIAAIALLCLTMRRSVIGLAFFGVAIVMLLFFIQNIKNALVFGVLIMAAAVFIIAKTDFVPSFNDRYELRHLDERALEEEKRLFEFDLIYNDVFVHHRYSAWFGFGLFNSSGNYGDGTFYDRSLHSDMTSIMHSGGLIGLTLYLLMMLSAFLTAMRRATGFRDRLVVMFCAAVFVTFALTGRFTQVGCMLLLMLALNIPVSVPEYEMEEEEETEELPEQGSLSVS